MGVQILGANISVDMGTAVCVVCFRLMLASCDVGLLISVEKLEILKMRALFFRGTSSEISSSVLKQPSVSSITFVLHTSHAIRACSLCPFTFLCQLLSTEVRISAGDGKPKCVDGFGLLDLIYQSKTAFCFCL